MNALSKITNQPNQLYAQTERHPRRPSPSSSSTHKWFFSYLCKEAHIESINVRAVF